MKTLQKTIKRLAMLAVVIVVAYGGWLYWTAHRAEQEQAGLGKVPTQKAEIRDITVSVSATGVLRPVRVVQVKSKAAGEIVRMPVELGDKVRQGDLIAQVETRFLEQELNQARADLESAEVRLQVAEKQYERAKQLQQQDLVSQQDLDTAEQNYSAAKAAQLRAAAELELGQERLADATVRAPAAGTIIAKNVEEGTVIASSTGNVSGGTTLVEISDLSRLEVRTLVDEIDIGQVKAGLPVQSTVEAYPERTFHGEVIKIEPQAVVEQQVTTFPVLSYIENTDGLLLPGMNADVEVVIHRRPQVVAVPNEAVRDIADAATVANLLNIPFDAQAIREKAGEMLTSRPTGAGRIGGEALADTPEVGGGGQEAAPAPPKPDAAGTRKEEEISLEKMRGMSREERQEYLNGFSEEARQKFQQQMRERFAAMRNGGAGSDTESGVGMAAFGIGRAPQPGVVFMVGKDGGMVPKQVMMGVQDWEYTEIVAGLQPGDEVVLLPSTSLLMSQQQLRERFSRFSRIPGTR